MIATTHLLDTHVPDPVRGQSFRDVLAALLRRPVVGRRGDLDAVTRYSDYLAALDDVHRSVVGDAVRPPAPRLPDSPSAGSTVGSPNAPRASRPARRITSRSGGGTGSP